MLQLDISNFALRQPKIWSLRELNKYAFYSDLYENFVQHLVEKKKKKRRGQKEEKSKVFLTSQIHQRFVAINS
jgi:hypothetical protein